MAQYQPVYTKEEIDELVNWFETHRYEQDIELGQGIHIRQLDTTLKQFCFIARNQYSNRTFSGPIHTLFRIREELIKQNKVIQEG